MEEKEQEFGGWSVGSCTDCLTQLGNLPEGVTTLHSLKNKKELSRAKADCSNFRRGPALGLRFETMSAVPPKKRMGEEVSWDTGVGLQGEAKAGASS